MFRIQKRIIVENFPGRDFRDIIYNLKLSWKYFKKFFYHVWWFRGRSYTSTLELLLLSLKEQHSTIAGNTHKDYMEPVHNLERCIELLDNLIKDEYLERCGYDYNYKIDFVPYKQTEDDKEVVGDVPNDEWFEMVSNITDEQQKHNDEVKLKADELKKSEKDEFFELFKNNYESWWC